MSSNYVNEMVIPQDVIDQAMTRGRHMRSIALKDQTVWVAKAVAGLFRRRSDADVKRPAGAAAAH